MPAWPYQARNFHGRITGTLQEITRTRLLHLRGPVFPRQLDGVGFFAWCTRESRQRSCRSSLVRPAVAYQERPAPHYQPQRQPRVVGGVQPRRRHPRRQPTRCRYPGVEGYRLRDQADMRSSHRRADTPAMEAVHPAAAARPAVPKSPVAAENPARDHWPRDQVPARGRQRSQER